MKFNPDELDFLKRLGIRHEEVHDGRNQSQAHRRIEAERLGKILVLGPPCQAAQHRLRTRAGHCVQCDPKKLAYQRRHTSPGFVYIAGSKSGKVLKIGTANDIDQRHRQLCAERYGELGDWVVLFHMKVDEGGRIEQAALSQLKKFITVRNYTKDGTVQKAAEILRCGFASTLMAVSDAIGDNERSELWMSPVWKEYDFKN